MDKAKIDLSLKESMEDAVSKLYVKDGEIKASTLVDSARPKSSPIHSAFEWDDKKAGEEYRLMQARQWIRKIVIRYQDVEERLVHVPFRIIEDSDDTGNKEGYYKPISVVVRNIDEYDRALEAIKGRLGAARKAYEELKVAADGAEDRPKMPNFKLADKGFTLLQTAFDG